MRAVLRLLTLGVVGAAMDAAPAAAQDSARVVVQYLAGGNVYLSGGAAAGMRGGDTLDVRRVPAGEAAGPLLVVASTSDRSVVAFLGAPYSLTRGDTLAVTIRHALRPAEPVSAVPVAGPAPAGAPPPRRTLRADGSLSLDLDYLQTRTTGLGADPQLVERNFTSPSVGVRYRLQGLPGGFEFRAGGRATQRSSTGDVVAPATLVQVYEAALYRRSGSFELELGRFYDPYEYFSGYWDGVLLHRGRESFGVGVLAGFEPDLGNGGPSGRYPKVAAFAHARAGRGSVRYRTSLSVTRVFPTDTTPVHTLAGVAQDLRAGRLGLTNTIQVDRNPESGRWVVTQFLGRLSTQVGRAGTVYAGYTIRQPYLLGPVTSVIPFRRDQVNAGFSVWSGLTSVYADVSTSRQPGLSDQWAVSASASRRSSRVGGVGGALSATWWTDSQSDGLLLSPSVTRRFGSTDLDLTYQFYRSAFSGTTTLSHAVELAARMPLGARTQFSARLRQQVGRFLQSSGVSAGLWYSF